MSDQTNWFNFTPASPYAVPGSLGYICSRIRAQSPKIRARWRESSRNNWIRRQSKRIVIRQWLDERAQEKMLG